MQGSYPISHGRKSNRNAFFIFPLCSACTFVVFLCKTKYSIPLCLLLALLHVLVAEERQGAADEDHGVKADAHAGLAGAAGAGLRGGGGLLGFGGRVVDLMVDDHVSKELPDVCRKGDGRILHRA